MNTIEARVYGMTCAHCVAAVREEVGAIPGVSEVGVDLVPGGPSTLRVHADQAIPIGALRNAVEEAGYRLGEGDAPARQLGVRDVSGNPSRARARDVSDG